MHYAVKTNCDEEIIKELVRLGQGFDCASTWEMQKVLEHGAKAEDIIFAHPCKAKSHIEFAKQVGVKLMTFDSKEEATKIAKIFPEAELVLRIAITDTDAPCPMGMKFGAPRELWSEILDTCN